ncbi:MAG: hypothetical protein IMZ61_01140 [Planctomycetes bacterium]|nr:hypothetical protein [Planctomycetota bacterium]
MITSQGNNPPDRDAKAHPSTPVGEVVGEVLLHLRSGQFEKAADVFLKAQEKGILPDNRDFTKKLLGILGETKSSQLIASFTFHPCQFCTKGRTKCEICRGSGRISEDAVCERCSGLGIARCNFCNGSAWMALSDIPEGIRAAALVQRAEKTFIDAKTVLDVPVPQISKDNPASTLKKCATLWVLMDKCIGVLENIVAITQTSMIHASDVDQSLGEITRKAVQTATELKGQVRKVVDTMLKSSQAETEIAPPDSGRAKIAKNRAAFYRALLDKSDLIYNLSDAHPLLENVISKRIAKKPSKKDNGSSS